jgi:hypothetical protein
MNTGYPQSPPRMTPSKAAAVLRSRLPLTPVGPTLYAALAGKLWPCGLPVSPGTVCGSTSYCRHRDWDEVMAFLESIERKEGKCA